MANQFIGSPVMPRMAPATRGLADVLRNRGFVACVVLLAVLTVGFEVLAALKGIQLGRKDAVAPKRPMNNLKQERLTPYRLKIALPPLQQDTEDQLGTKDYVQWLLATPESTDNEPMGRLVSLFVSYYTGQPDPVPHVPDVCMVASGYTLMREDLDSVTISVDGQPQAVPLQVGEYHRTGMLGTRELCVVYTFHANGAFRRDREAVRLAVADPRSQYAYFSKVEVSMDLGHDGYASRAQAVEVAKRFLQVALPVLVHDHWPDWSAVMKTGTATQASPGGAAAR